LGDEPPLRSRARSCTKQGDYGQARGLRAPNGRLRPATGAVMRAIRQLRESAR
jgi:hypothetical protein